MRLHRVAVAYGSDPYTVSTWAPDRFALAVATLDLVDTRRAERIHEIRPMAVLDVGAL